MTDQWDFVIAAYVLTALLTVVVLATSWRAMRKAEQRAEALKRER